ncbi:MAG: gfo/Idh/MocA family oxidoreductase [Thermoprotei archaeon]|nr:MAG: gfo/Idh/MocA family oxidoreductase [Thermoprotei archaeon]RLF25666.1 MAG: gfo/Idh/MocA family oxidoreductase [Thermoprotei archaeon]
MSGIKAAIISFAHIHAYSYARVLKMIPEVEFVAIWDDNEERGRSAANTYKVPNYYKDLDELFKKHKDLDFVIVTSENARHYEHVRKALEEDVHVLCEKPFTTNIKHADELIALASKKGLKLGTCFVMRHHAAVVAAKQAIDAGELGQIVSVTTTNHGTCPYKEAHWFVEPELSYGERVPLKPDDKRYRGGCVTDHTVHCADLLRWILGSEVAEVYAEVGLNIRKDLEVEDNALVMLRFRNGVQASIDCSWSRPEGVFPTWGDVNLHFIGTQACLDVESFIQNLSLATWKIGRFVYHYWGTDVDYELIMDFIRAIKEDRPPRATGWDGRQATEIMLAAYESISRGKPITLPLL